MKPLYGKPRKKEPSVDKKSSISKVEKSSLLSFFGDFFATKSTSKTNVTENKNDDIPNAKEEKNIVVKSDNSVPVSINNINALKLVISDEKLLNELNASESIYYGIGEVSEENEKLESELENKAEEFINALYDDNFIILYLLHERLIPSLKNIGIYNVPTYEQYKRIFKLNEIKVKKIESDFLMASNLKNYLLGISTIKHDKIFTAPSSDNSLIIRPSYVNSKIINFLSIEEYKPEFEDYEKFIKFIIGRINLNKYDDYIDYPLLKSIREKGYSEYFTNIKRMAIRVNLRDRIQTKYNCIIPRMEQEAHSYIVGGTKSGKSELIKYLYVQEILKGNRNGILLDPHGDLAEEIAKIAFLYPDINKSIIYLDTSIKYELGNKYDDLFVINPFDVDKSYLEDNDKLDNLSSTLSKAFEEIVKANNSPNMRALLVPCISVLLRKPNADITDLKRFMNDELNEDLIKLGLQSKNKAHVEYFKYEFIDKKSLDTKRALSIRLQIMLNSTLFTKMTCGKSTINFYDFVRGTGKYLIIRLNKENTSAIQNELGILFITSILNAAFSLRKHERKGVHLFVDEFQNFVVDDMENILSEARKYKLYMTLAHQYTDQIINTTIKKSVLSNTNIKLVGSVGGNTVSTLNNNGEKKLTQDIVDNLKSGKFVVRIKHRGARYDYLNVPSTTVKGLVKDINKDDYKKFLLEQYKLYYKSDTSRPTEKKVVKETKKSINFDEF